jgi:transposase
MEGLFLPPYSPEFNSIETLWSQVKQRMKQLLSSDAQTHTLTKNNYEAKIHEAM